VRSDEFLRLSTRRPFEPFRVYLSTGQKYEIRHPEMAMVERSIVGVHMPAVGAPVPLPERKLFIVLLHIVRGEFIQAGTSPTTNGGAAS